MKLTCDHCSAETVVADGGKAPPWCTRCGADFRPVAGLASQVSFAAVVSQPQATKDQHICKAAAAASDAVCRAAGVNHGMRLFQCAACRAEITIEEGQAPPPWCRKCGADFRITAVASDESRPASSTVVSRQNVSASEVDASYHASGPQASAVEITREAAEARAICQSVSPGVWFAEDCAGRDERFARHNLVLGLGLAVWGFVMSSSLVRDPAQDFLESHSTLTAVMDGLQLLVCLNGIRLFVSGIGLRRREAWGVEMARVSAVISIVGGVVFVMAWQTLLKASEDGTLMDSMATATFVRSNMDLLIGLLDGITLLLLLRRSNRNQSAVRPEVRPLPA